VGGGPRARQSGDRQGGYYCETGGAYAWKKPAESLRERVLLETEDRRRPSVLTLTGLHTNRKKGKRNGQKGKNPRGASTGGMSYDMRKRNEYLAKESRELQWRQKKQTERKGGGA